MPLIDIYNNKYIVSRESSYNSGRYFCYFAESSNEFSPIIKKSHGSMLSKRFVQ